MRRSQKEYAPALAYFDKALRYKPGNALIHNDARHRSLVPGSPERCHRRDGAAIKLDPSLVHAYVNRASAYLHTGKLEPAVADSTAAIKLDRKSVPAYQIRREAYKKLNKPQAAEADEAAIRELTKPIFKSSGP